jgi:hypothetical protein
MADKPTTDETEGDRLRKEHKRAIERYEWAISELSRQRETAHGEDFDKLMVYFNETRAEKDAALRALKLFESEHPKK